MPLVFLSVIDAMYPRLVSSAATKYSPETPALIPLIFSFSVTSYSSNILILQKNLFFPDIQV